MYNTTGTYVYMKDNTLLADNLETAVKIQMRIPFNPATLLPGIYPAHTPANDLCTR